MFWFMAKSWVKKKKTRGLGGLKCSQNAKKKQEDAKGKLHALFNAHFADLVSKEYFPYNVL